MKFLFVSAIILMLMLTPVQQAHASDPSEAVITMQSAHAYRNLNSFGDMAVICHWRWASDNNSETPASSAVTIRLVSANGTTLAITSPYVFSLFENDGYGDGVTGFYLSDNSSWGTAVKIQISGLPAFFDPIPDPFEYTLSAADFTDSATQALNRSELNTYILQTCDIFKTIYPDVELKSVADVGTVLSSYGEAYFTSAIPGLLNLCPSLFFVQTYIPQEIPVEDYDMSLGDTYADRMVGTDLMRGTTRMGSYIGVSGAVIWGIFVFIGCLAVVLFTSKKGWGLEIALAIDALIVVGFSILIGDLLFTIAMIMGLIAMMGIAWALVGKRA